MDILIKYAVRQLLAYLKDAVDATATKADDDLYRLLRSWAVEKGFIDPGGADDPDAPPPEDEPGPVTQGGDGGGP